MCYCLGLPFVFQGGGSLTVKGFTKHEVACLCQKGGGTLAIFMYYWMNSGNIHVLWAAFMYCYRSIHVLLELWTHTQDVTLHCGRSGRWYGSGPATEVTHLRLNQPPVFPVFLNSCILYSEFFQALISQIFHSLQKYFNKIFN